MHLVTHHETVRLGDDKYITTKIKYLIFFLFLFSFVTVF